MEGRITPEQRARATIAIVLAALFLAAGAVLRVYGLEKNPPGFWQDEASTGIDAYLIWTTGRDRAGVFLPVIARSFGDYPLALYRYLDAPIVGLLGLTPGHERIVAAIAGTLMVLATALLARRVIGDRGALGALFAAACCPTWIHFSRYGSEAILLPFCLVLGWAAIERAKATARWGWLWAGAAALAASAYTYHAVKLFLPLWLIGFVAYQWPLITSLWHEHKKHLFGPIAVFAALVLPSVLAALTPEGQARGNTVLAWRHYSGWELYRVVLNNYLSYFELGLLFVRGGPAVAQSIPGIGLWNLIELPLMFVGLVAMARGRVVSLRTAAFLLFWLAIGPLPGGVTYETHNIGRVIAWLPAPQLISGIGFAALAGWALDEAHRARLAVLSAVLLLWIVTAVQVSYLTLVRYPRTTERDWQFEIGRSMECARKLRKDEQVVIAPQFQAAEVFARFYFEHLPKIAPDKPAWLFGNRDEVRPGELYVFPSGQPIPIGEKVCQITLTNSESPLAFVYASKGVARSGQAVQNAAKTFLPAMPAVPAQLDIPMVKLSTPTDRQMRDMGRRQK